MIILFVKMKWKFNLRKLLILNKNDLINWSMIMYPPFKVSQNLIWWQPVWLSYSYQEMTHYVPIYCTSLVSAGVNSVWICFNFIISFCNLGWLVYRKMTSLSRTTPWIQPHWHWLVQGYKIQEGYQDLCWHKLRSYLILKIF